MRNRIIAVALLLGLFAGIPMLAIAWSSIAFLYDPHDIVEAAFIEDHEGRRLMATLPFGWYAFYVQSDGQFAIRCTNGAVREGGYVTGLMGETMTVGKDCTLK